MTYRNGAFPLPVPPTPDGPEGQTLVRFDPGPDILMRVVVAALRYELAEAFTVAASQTSLKGKGVVESYAPHEPTEEYLRTNIQKLPCLFVHRGGEVSYSPATLALRQASGQIRIDYVLGPFKSDEKRRLGGIVVAFEKILNKILQDGGHRAYRASEDGMPISLLTGDLTGFTKLELAGVVGGLANFGGENSTDYFSATATLNVLELEDLGESEFSLAMTGMGGTGDLYSDEAEPEGPIEEFTKFDFAFED